MKRYFTLFLLLLATEIAIALFPVPVFVRGFVGDVLVIPLLYTFLRMFVNLPGKWVLFLVLAFAFFVEFLQLFSITEWLGIENPVARIILGNTFDGWDLAAYLFGVLPVLFIEKYIAHATS